MKILEKLGLGRKKKNATPFTSGKSREEKVRSSLSGKKYVKVAISLLFLATMIFLHPRTTIQDVTAEIGQPWRDDDLTAPFTFSLIKDEEELQREIREVETRTAPIFHIDDNVNVRIQTRLDSLFRHIAPVLDSYVAWQISRVEQSETAENDSLQFIQHRNQSGVGLDDNGWRALLDSYSAIQLPETGVQKPEVSRFVGIDIRLQLEQIISQVLRDGVVNLPVDELTLGEITVRNLQQRTERSYSVANVRDIYSSRDYARIQLARTLDENAAVTATQLYNLVIEPNLIYNEDETRARIQEGIEEISPTKGAVAAGQVIIRRGDLVTQERFNMLQSLAQARADRATDLERWRRYTGEAIIILTIFSVFFMYLYLYRRQIYDDSAMFLLVFLVIGVISAVSALFGSIENFSPYMVPIALAPVILTIIFDSRVGLMSIVTIAMLTAFMHGHHFEYIIATIVAGSIAVYSVRDIKNSKQFYLITPGLLYVSYAVVLVGFTLTKVGGWASLVQNLGFLLPNAVGIWLTAPLIWLIEKVFKVTTDVSLLELSDTNQPVLKELMNRAPGSFHHSLQVANMSEAAASAIGANPLLCRVGGLYHDIGKLDRPEYFVENQTGRNEHDKLKPRMSALIIKNHVSKGVKIAREINLPDVIIDFIRTHHGTSLIRYFYDKAALQSDEKQEVREEDFRYDGPIPHTKETGILLLADCIEAASRSMDDPNYSKLENLVNRMVDERMIEGQLNNCSLTFQNLTVIKESFLKILVGMYHGRIKYPDKESGGESKPEDIPFEDKANIKPTQVQ